MRKKVNVRRGIALAVGTSVLCTSIISANTNTVAENNGYKEALKYALQFYDANKCGSDAGNNVSSWRGACHVNDGKDVGRDLSGGYHDCGDHVNFGITCNYDVSVIGWGLHD